MISLCGPCDLYFIHLYVCLVAVFILRVCTREWLLIAWPWLCREGSRPRYSPSAPSKPFLLLHAYNWHLWALWEPSLNISLLTSDTDALRSSWWRNTGQRGQEVAWGHAAWKRTSELVVWLPSPGPYPTLQAALQPNPTARPPLIPSPGGIFSEPRFSKNGLWILFTSLGPFLWNL